MVFVDLMAVSDRVVRKLLGGSIVYRSGVGEAVTAPGVFDLAYVKVDAGQPGVSSTGPAVFLALAELSSNPSDDPAATVTVDGVTYTAHEVMPDGLGGVRLLLHQV